MCYTWELYTRDETKCILDIYIPTRKINGLSTAKEDLAKADQFIKSIRLSCADVMVNSGIMSMTTA